MKVVVAIAAVAAGIATLVSAPVSAAGAFGNIGSIVMGGGGCSDMAGSALGNIGSIVSLGGGGNCSVDEISRGFSHRSSSMGNIGSIVIDNACGGSSSGNIGSIVLAGNSKNCDHSRPTTVMVKPIRVVETRDVEVQTVAKPQTLPETGAGNIIGLAAAVTAAGYASSLVFTKIRSKRQTA